MSEIPNNPAKFPSFFTYIPFIVWLFPSKVPVNFLALSIPIGSQVVPAVSTPFSCLAPISISFSKYTIVLSVISSPSFSSSVSFPFTNSSKYFISSGVYICQFLLSSAVGLLLLVPSHISAFPSIMSPLSYTVTVASSLVT